MNVMARKEDFYYMDLTLKCRLTFAKEIKTHMGNLTGRELISRFQLTPFGPWLHVTMTDGHPTLVHMFLQREVIVRNADRDVMYFDVYGRHMHFGSAEFCLLTGLRFGPEPSLPPLAVDGFVSRVWPGTNPEDLKVDMVVQRVKRGLRDYSDDDIIRVCIVLMVEVMFMGRELYSIVSETVLRAVEDLDICSRFPWGSYIWAHTFKQLHLAIMRRKDKHSKMTLSGFVYAFKIWIVEMFPVAQENFILRSDRFIRGTRWDRAAAMNKSTCLAMFNSVNSSRPPLGELEPTDAELAQPWFRESIAFIRRSAETPSTKRSLRSSPNEDDEDDAQPQHPVGVNDRYEAPPPPCYSHDGMSHPDPYQAKWDELSALDCYVREEHEKHEKRLKAVEDICSQFNAVHMSIPQSSYIPAVYTQAAPETFATTSTFTPQNFRTSGADCYVPQIARSYDMSSYVTPPGYMMPGSSYVTSISTGYMQNGDETNFEGCIAHGPWGGSEGKSWVYKPKGFIKEISIMEGWGGVIAVILFFSTDGCEDFGGNCIKSRNKILLDHPSEYLMSISGTFGNYKGSIVLKSLCFGTNHKHYGPYGSDTGTPFSYDGKGGVIVGFHGRANDKNLNAIGIYVMPKSLALGRNIICEDNSIREQCLKMSKKAMPRETGPFGGCGGEAWDDGVFSTVKQVHVLVEESLNIIYSIQFVYEKRYGKAVLSPMHGGTYRDKMESVSVVNVDGTDEYLTGISGFYGPVKGYNGAEAITSITFHTNKRKHGPYGEETAAGYNCFTSKTSPGKVVGFHGRSDSFLSAIGVHMQYF